MRKFLFIAAAVLLLTIAVTFACQWRSRVLFSSRYADFPVLTGPYLGQEPPEGSPRPFLHDLFAKDSSLHAPPVFSVDGSEVYWTPMDDALGGIHFMRRTNGKWDKPQALTVPLAVMNPGDPCISPDGSRLYITGHTLWSKEKILFLEREKGGWSRPVSVGDRVNSLNLHWQVSVNSDLDLYFQVRNEDLTDGMIYCSEYRDGEYQSPRKLGERINTEAWENFPFIARDNSYLIFSRTFAETGDDLMISFRQADGQWGEPINMEAVNSSTHDMYPVVTPDGQYLFFLSWRDGGSWPYWVDTGIIEELKKKSGSGL